MRTLLLVALLAAVAGCGGNSKTVLDTTPLTDEQKAKLAQETKQVEDEESPKNKTRIEKKKK